MGRLRTYECPSCTGRFEEYHHRSDEAAPRFCKLCGFDTVSEPNELAMPHLATGKARPVDDLHRAMEQGAEWRAQKAEGMGASSAEAAGLKITDMRDHLREGDTANVPISNSVTAAMAGQQMGHVAQTQAMQYSGPVQTGPSPNAGLRNIQALRNLHNTQERNPVFENPALETQSPLYARRI